MNILFINNLYGDAATGGAEEIMRIRAERHRAAGDQVFILATCRVGEERIEKKDHITVCYIAPKGRKWLKDIATYSQLRKLCWLLHHFLDTHTPKQIIAFCNTYAIDRVETHNIIGISMLLPRMLHDAGIDHHHYLHDVQLVEPSGILPTTHTKDSFMQTLYSVATRGMFLPTPVVSSPTKFLKKFYQSRGFFVHSDWRVEHEELFCLKKQEERKRKIKGGEVKRYLFVGYLGEHKGVRQLLSAWKKRGSEISNQESSTLTIVGDGVLRPLVERAVEEDFSITYLGRIPHEDLEPIYADHDVLLFPSQCIENRPNVIAEAMAYGLEIIAVKTGGVAEMVEGYKKVTLIEPKSGYFASL